MEQRKPRSINWLSIEIGHDRRTWKKVLVDVQPAGTGPRGEPTYSVIDALAALHAHTVKGTPRSAVYREPAGAVDRYLLETGGVVGVLAGPDVLRVFEWEGWPDLKEALGWGLPFARAGSPSSTRGWYFALTYTLQWLRSVARDVGAEVDPNLPGLLRRLRGGRPLHLPTAYVTLAEIAAPERSRRANGSAHNAGPGPGDDRSAGEGEGAP